MNRSAAIVTAAKMPARPSDAVRPADRVTSISGVSAFRDACSHGNRPSAALVEPGVVIYVDHCHAASACHRAKHRHSRSVADSVSVCNRADGGRRQSGIRVRRPRTPSPRCPALPAGPPSVPARAGSGRSDPEPGRPIAPSDELHRQRGPLVGSAFVMSILLDVSSTRQIGRSSRSFVEDRSVRSRFPAACRRHTSSTPDWPPVLRPCDTKARRKLPSSEGLLKSWRAPVEERNS